MFMWDEFWFYTDLNKPMQFLCVDSTFSIRDELCQLHTHAQANPV